MCGIKVQGRKMDEPVTLLQLSGKGTEGGLVDVYNPGSFEIYELGVVVVFG